MKRAPAIIILLLANLAHGQPSEPPAPPSGGFYLRGQLGAMGLSAADDTATLSGGGVDLSLALGYRTASRWVLYGELFGAATVGLDASIEGQSGSCDQCSMTLGSALLPGLGTGYYTASGFNFLASLHAPILSTDVRGEKNHTDRGFLALLTAGREWPVGDAINLGAALRLGIGSIEEAGVGLFSVFVTGSYR